MGKNGRQWDDTVIRGKFQAFNEGFPVAAKASKDRSAML
jgi:hypothetical protein